MAMDVAWFSTNSYGVSESMDDLADFSMKALGCSVSQSSHKMSPRDSDSTMMPRSEFSGVDSANSIETPSNATSSGDFQGHDAPAEDWESTAAVIEIHLEAMNLATDELNNAQNELTTLMHERNQRLANWELASARFSQALPKVYVAKSAVYFDCKRQCEEAHRVVETATMNFLRAVDSGSTTSPSELSELAATHAQSLSNYQSLQRSLAEIKSSTGLSARALKAALPYYDAKAMHLQEMTSLDAAVQRLGERVKDAKAFYRSALRGLESISEAMHVDFPPLPVCSEMEPDHSALVHETSDCVK
jgi:hypothetical protein